MSFLGGHDGGNGRKISAYSVHGRCGVGKSLSLVFDGKTGFNPLEVGMKTVLGSV